MSQDTRQIRAQIDELEAKLGQSSKSAEKPTGRSVVLAQIAELEGELSSYGMENLELSTGEYMDDVAPQNDPDEFANEEFDDEESMDDVAVENDAAIFMEEGEVEQSTEEYMDEIDDDEIGDFDDDSLAMPVVSTPVASEIDPSGVEEDITQDYLDEVQKLAPSTHGTELASHPSTLEVGKDRKAAITAAKLYMTASVKLDKVAAHLEKNGEKQAAFQLDKITDEIDNEIQTIIGGLKNV